MLFVAKLLAKSCLFKLKDSKPVTTTDRNISNQFLSLVSFSPPESIQKPLVSHVFRGYSNQWHEIGQGTIDIA